MNPTKFGSLHLNTPRSRYEFLNLVFKSVKNKKNQNKHSDWQMGPAGQPDPRISDTGTEAAFDRRQLVDGKISGGSVTMVALPALPRI